MQGERVMKILVYGAGNVGSLYAAKLNEAGNDVTLLARGECLREIREHGIRLQEFYSGQKTMIHVRVVERLTAEDAYDLVLVILPRNRVSEALPILAANRNTPSVMFFGNNAGGPEAMIKAIGRERVLLGFPGASAVRCDEYIQYLILDRREQPTTIGELEGTVSKRIKAIATTLKDAGFPVSISRNMDAWLKTHAAEIIPTAAALYMAGGVIGELKSNRQTLVLMIRAIREGHRVLSSIGVPITPPIHKIFRWIPERLLLAITRRKLDDKAASIKLGHASDAREEMKTLANEFRKLVSQSGIATPAIDQLRPYLDATIQRVA
ncbi:protein containing Ketopantoate reductase ApbA/PanE [Rhodopirellula maiorica SM1]|uniref:Protein containing Ketopantoate reductase ApbA/PanE n=2 Tax=Novipirellula TaxID=2795426 RepID=M5RJ47_9BACT|nr:protein containing Ketopantoate reductase ApbA/PanE [Rhodopirellula maiorica SM1]